jgi:hypothetical protein
MSGKPKLDIIFHFGELNMWLGQNWKSNFKHDIVDVVLPKGTEMKYDSYRQAILSRYTERPINHIINTRGYDGSGVRIGVVGFSQTCIGANVLLNTPDGGAIDFVYACDGIHLVSKKHIDYAKMCAFGYGDTNQNITKTNRQFIITYSDTPRPGNALTTGEAAKLIIDEVLKESPDGLNDVSKYNPNLMEAEHNPPIDTRCGYPPNTRQSYDRIPGDYYFNIGGFLVMGYKRVRVCNDHIYQSKVIAPLVMREMIIPRWNAPKTGGSCTIT